MRDHVLGKIAADLDRAMMRREQYDEPGCAVGTRVADGDGWSVEDVICTFGPNDRSFGEQHSGVSIGMVLAGTFQYRSRLGRSLMVSGSFLLGNHRERYECGHEHAAGDRCVAFRFTPDYFDRLASDAGVPSDARRFRVSRFPPARESATLVARTLTAICARERGRWEGLAIEVASTVARLAAGLPETHVAASASAVA